MKVYKIELMIIDFDGLGEKEVTSAIENARYPNRCISPDVKSIQTREVEWSDSHPLNRTDTCDAEYQRLFSNG